MISRRTTVVLSEVYSNSFYSSYQQKSFSSYSVHTEYRVDVERLYDFVFVNDYPGWFCNLIKSTRNSGRRQEIATRTLKKISS